MLITPTLSCTLEFELIGNCLFKLKVGVFLFSRENPPAEITQISD